MHYHHHQWLLPKQFAHASLRRCADSYMAQAIPRLSGLLFYPSAAVFILQLPTVALYTPICVFMHHIGCHYAYRSAAQFLRSGVLLDRQNDEAGLKHTIHPPSWLASDTSDASSAPALSQSSFVGNEHVVRMKFRWNGSFEFTAVDRQSDSRLGWWQRVYSRLRHGIVVSPYRLTRPPSSDRVFSHLISVWPPLAHVFSSSFDSAGMSPQQKQKHRRTKLHAKQVEFSRFHLSERVLSGIDNVVGARRARFRTYLFTGMICGVLSVWLGAIEPAVVDLIRSTPWMPWWDSVSSIFSGLDPVERAHAGIAGGMLNALVVQVTLSGVQAHSDALFAHIHDRLHDKHGDRLRVDYDALVEALILPAYRHLYRLDYPTIRTARTVSIFVNAYGDIILRPMKPGQYSVSFRRVLNLKLERNCSS